MKKRYFLLALMVAVHFLGCTKTIHDRRSRSTVTPESREYFGCRVNGADFVSEASAGNVSGFCYYQIKYEKTAGRIFQVFSDKFESTCKNSTVGITLDSVDLVEGKRYDLGAKGEKKNYGTFFLVPDCSQDRIELNTTDGMNNYIIIKKFDRDKKVVTGIFNFTVNDEFGHLYQITDGIFDRHFQD
ncbi:MAG TPA: hypothetical protein VM101_14195 [Flavitalea sp.]|nr:hypothetical protein [Flavitalea sp.]